MKAVCLFLLCVSFTLVVSQTLEEAEMDRCPHEIYIVGLVTCDSNTPCADKNRLCVKSPSLSTYPMGVCARPPCLTANNCKPGRFCYKKYVTGLPILDIRTTGICC